MADGVSAKKTLSDWYYSLNTDTHQPYHVASHIKKQCSLEGVAEEITGWETFNDNVELKVEWFIQHDELEVFNVTLQSIPAIEITPPQTYIVTNPKRMFGLE